jgi:hypothetical protein
MASDKKMLADAALVAIRNKSDIRTYLLGAVGLRADGVVVSSPNIPSRDFTNERSNHAEVRLARKLTLGSTVWVARVARKDGSWAMAKPCRGCERRLRATGVERIVYTIGPNEWGVISCGS